MNSKFVNLIESWYLGICEMIDYKSAIRLSICKFDIAEAEALLNFIERCYF